MTLLNIPCNILHPASQLICWYIIHICNILGHLPLSLTLPSLLQYPLRMVAPPSPPFSPEHHKLLQHLKSLICFTFTGPEIILQDHIKQSIQPPHKMFISSTKCSFYIHKMFIEKVRLTSFSFSLLKWAIPETKAQFSRWEDSRYWIRNNVNWIRNTGH